MPYIITACVILAVIIFVVVIHFSIKGKGARRDRGYRPSFGGSVEEKGEEGERKVARVLGNTQEGVQYVINDCTLRVGEGKTVQIDHILINKHGIYVIETKNYAGRIYGNDNQQEWTQVLQNGRVQNKFYNPVRQNKSHVYHVSQVVNEHIPIISAVVFPQGNIHFIESMGAYNLNGLRQILEKGEGNVSPEQMKRVFEKLSTANDKTITKTEHIQNIRTLQVNVANNVCPRCGKRLVRRSGKNGDFLGCEGYPNCKFTKRLDR